MTELATIPALAVVDTKTGEQFDLADLNVDQAARIYPHLQRATSGAKRMLEIEMEQRGAAEWIGPGFAYTFLSDTEWQVDAVALRKRLLELAELPSSGIGPDEVDAAIQIVVTGKANKTKINQLAKRSASVKEAIESAYSATTTAPRLRVKEK